MRGSRSIPVALVALALTLVAAPTRAQEAEPAPVLLARATAPGPLRPGLRAVETPAPEAPAYRLVAMADREMVLQAAVGGAILGCALGVFMGPEQGSAFGCAVGGLAGAGVGALMGSGL